MTTPQKNKLGPISAEEKAQIEQLASTGMSLEEISRVVRRNEDTVHRVMAEQGLIPGEAYDLKARKDILTKLYQSEHWSEIQRQFSEEEVEKFKAMWVRTLMQFKEDAQFTEEISIRDMLTFQILMDRNMVLQHQAINEAVAAENELMTEMRKPPSTRDMALVEALQTRVHSYRAAQEDYHRTFMKLNEEKTKIQKTMRATREQRVKIASEGKMNIVGFLRMLDELTFREREGREMMLIDLATRKEYERLTQEITYDDGSEDYPILSPEVIEEKYGSKN